MRAVGRPLSIEQIEVDDPAANEVLIDVTAVGLCHSDLKFLDGDYTTACPAVLGHEAAGVVAGVGAGVAGIRPGDHVVTSLSVSCGSCSYCRSRRTHLCSDKSATRRQTGAMARLHQGSETITQGFDLGAFAEKMVVHESAVVVIDDDIPDEVAALMGCGVATGLGAVFNTAVVEAGDTVAVIGCGGVGLSAIQAARIVGAGKVIALDRNPASLVLARDLGATHVVGPADGDPVSAVRALTEDEGVDHVIEAVGSVVTVQQAFSMTRRGGTATVVGLIPTGVSIPVSGDELFYERRLQGSVMGSNDFKRDTLRYLDLYRDGSLLIDAMLGPRIALEGINEGFDRMRAGEPGRALVTFG